MIKRLALIGIICLAAGFINNQQPQSECTHSANSSDTLSWGQLLSNDHQSYLSHFLDLIELMYGSNDKDDSL